MLAGAVGAPGLHGVDAMLAARAAQALQHVLRTLRGWSLGPLQDACHSLCRATGSTGPYPPDGPDTYATASAAAAKEGAGALLLDLAALGQCVLLRTVRTRCDDDDDDDDDDDVKNALVTWVLLTM